MQEFYGLAVGNNSRFANAINAMLTKSGNLSGLTNLKQSQLNLGVIESLLGEVFNTDNCTVIQNANGMSFRSPQGLQVAIAFRGDRLTATIEANNIWLGGPITVPWPSPFTTLLHAAPIGAWDGGPSGGPQGSIAWPFLRGKSNSSVVLHIGSQRDDGSSTVGAIGIGLWK